MMRIALLLLCLVLLLTGCGNPGQKFATAPASVHTSGVLRITWPARGRLIPLATESIAVTITGPGGYEERQEVNRPTSTNSSQVSFTALPIGQLTVTASAYPEPYGMGIAQATATETKLAQLGIPVNLTLTMQSTIATVAVTAHSTQLTYGSMLPVTATARNSNGEMVMVPTTDAFTWTSSDMNIAHIDNNGLVTAGQTPGQVTITAIERESGKTGSLQVIVYNPNLNLQQPVEDPMKPGMVGGTLFSLVGGTIDYPYGATVTLTSTQDEGASYTAQTTSTVRGSFRFENVPAGAYTMQASITASADRSVTLTASVDGVHVHGNLPTLMTNLILGTAAEAVTFHGTITQDGLPAASAVVTVDVSGNTLDMTGRISALLTTLTDAQGRYTLTVPSSGMSYYIAAHNATSLMTDSGQLRNLTPGTKVVNLTLNNATATPVFSKLQLDHCTVTLPAPTTTASRQTRITRAAVARALGNPQLAIRLEKLGHSRDAYSRSLDGFVENDLYWSVLENDAGVCEYNIYRATSLQGPYTYLGSARDPYQQYFFDNDTMLQNSGTCYYTVTSVAANDQVSAPAVPMAATPLPQLSGISPTNGASVAPADARVSWLEMAGAHAYILTIYNTVPSFNLTPIHVQTLPTGTTFYALDNLPPGSYWWSISAYNTPNPLSATAATYSAYRELVIQ